jgi:hypothetical protein
MSRTTHRRWMDRETPRYPWRRMTRRSWLCYFLGPFSRLLLSHILHLFYWPVVWNGLLHIFGKQLTKSRADSTESSRRLSSILFPNTCFRTLWSDGLRLLLLTVCGPSDHYSRTVRSYLGLFSLSTWTVRYTHDRWPWSGVRSCLPPGASGLSFVRSLPSNHSAWHIWCAGITNDDIFIFTFIGRTRPNYGLFARWL